MENFDEVGFDSFPGLYHDERRTADFADSVKWPIERIRKLAESYIEFSKGDVMPRAFATAEKIIGRAVFEIVARENETLDYQILKNKDETCEEI